MAVTGVGVDVGHGVPTGQTNAYLLGTDDALLVDPGGRSQELDRQVAERSVSHVAVTHHHPDHCAAVAHYADVTDATVWARRGREAAFRETAGIEPDRTFLGGESIPTDDGAIGVLDTPGHAAEHVSFCHPDGLVCGDLAIAEGSVAVAAPEGDLRSYLSSLRRVHAGAPSRLFPGHGPVVTDVRGTCRRLVSHRLTRERRVLAAVERGAQTVSEVCDAAYEKDLTGVREMAEATVRAHLEKLAVEQRIEWDGHRAGPC
ncbi:MBL fold metallo-hydrolase [Haloarculaceae archaeon H-GB2-1]|nr:MBL fold metallo-hydrolase [Haloarculaceae archaeon H-GB1-1]MEA5387633.1 MBL fold metallo-hydrolase [Haloarculaceae archaeon H-GB11]MEA5409120.1 MBL fold metallo-hydrolase [Haloarculaceae archaeon H-GB2-1]